MSGWPASSDNGVELKPFLAHLEDLRCVLIRCAVALAVCSGIALAFTPQILAFLKAPLHGIVENPDVFLRSLEVTGAFASMMRIGLWSGVVLAAPFLVIIIGGYLLPALTPAERKAIGGVGAFGIVLFLAGVWMGYRFTLPFALQAMFAMNSWMGVAAEWTLTSYVTFTTQLLVAFGLAFELPVVLLILGRLGIIGSAWLRTYRRHAIVGILVLGAILTPPDVFSQLIMSIPLVLLYELCIWIVWTWERARRTEAAGPVPSPP